MDNYTLMRLSDMQDEDAVEQDEVEQEETGSLSEFKSKYKEKYTDIKINIKEDW